MEETNGGCLKIPGWLSQINVRPGKIEAPNIIVTPLLQKWLVLPDIHAPFHNLILIAKICQFAREFGFYGVVMAGDFLDLFTLSKYAEDSLAQLREIDLTWEYDNSLPVIEQINAAVGVDCKKVYLYGNHDDRYQRYMKSGDHSKLGKELRDPIKALRLVENNYTILTNWMDDVYTLGEHLDITHGTACGIHTAKKMLDDHQGSVAFGHSHRFQSFILGKRGAYNLGWLGDPDSWVFKYMPRVNRNKWALGFGVVYILPDGTFRMEPIQCYGNQFVAGGKLY